MKNAYINDLLIHDYQNPQGIWLKPNIQGLEMPDVRLPSFERPNIDGAFVPNQLYGGRPITLEGKITGVSLAAYRERRRLFENAVKIYRPNGVLAPVTFKFTTMDDLALQVEAYTRKITLPDTLIMGGNWKLDLFAPNIRLLSQELHQTRINIFEGGGMSIPMPIPMDMSIGGSVESAIANAGNFSSFPFFTIIGSIEDPTVSNQTTGESFSIDYTLTTSSERIEIDVENRTVLYYSSPTAAPVNIRQYFSGSWFDLEPGNNTVKLVVTDTSDSGYLNVQWRDAYIGI